MQEPTLDQVAPGGVVQLGQSPAGLDDATFDSLFPAEPSQTAIQATQQPVAAPAQQSTDQSLQDSFFLKGEHSVYKTVEEATKGINEKDVLIEQMRQRYALTTGIDPITGKPVTAQGQPQEGPDYYQQPDQYLDALYAAAKKGGPEAYRDVQAKFLFDALKPIQPVFQKLAKDQAIETLTVELPGAKSFVGTPEYTRSLDTNPELKQAISISESDQRFHSRLPGLYKLAYLTAQGMRLPELLKAQATQTQTTSQTQTQGQPVRTTVQATTTNAPGTTARPTFKNIEGIKATIADMEARGIKLDF
jgi:hypothetical protein